MPQLYLPPRSLVVLEAIHPTTGAAVGGVAIGNITISAAGTGAAGDGGSVPSIPPIFAYGPNE